MTANQRDRRKYDRLFYHSTIQMTNQTQISRLGHTLNLSDGGLLIKCDDNYIPEIDEIIEVQSMSFPEAPIKKVIVRRITKEGQIAVQFIE